MGKPKNKQIAIPIITDENGLFVPPDFTILERDSISPPIKGGTLIYNKDTLTYQYWNESIWIDIQNVNPLNIQIITTNKSINKTGIYLIDTSNGIVNISLGFTNNDIFTISNIGTNNNVIFSGTVNNLVDNIVYPSESFQMVYEKITNKYYVI